METSERGNLLRKRFLALGGHAPNLSHRPKRNTAPTRGNGPSLNLGVSRCERRCEWVKKMNPERRRTKPNDAEKKAIQAICEKAPRKLKLDSAKIAKYKL
jgi:hypothetical protein